MALGDQLVDARLAHRDQRELGGDEEPVGEDQRENGEQADGKMRRVEHPRAPWADSSGALPRRSKRAQARRLLKKWASTNSSMAA